MKKNLLLLLFVFIYALGNAQVVFYVQPPSPFEGSYDMTYAEDWGSLPDLTDPANAVIGELVFAYDASPTADSLCCEDPGSIVTDVDGKIAMIYRGVCNFSLKALNAQNAGAIACVIITYEGEDPVGMAGGDFGPDVTIPVVMITRAAAEALKPSVQLGGVEAFIGNKSGYYPNDLAIAPNFVVRAPEAARNQLLTQDDNDFTMAVGTWFKNDGYNESNGVVITATIEQGGSELYSESVSLDTAVASLDSTFIGFPDFSLSTYPNDDYTIVYSVSSDSTDSFDADNSFNAVFTINDPLFSYVNIDENGPVAVDYYRPRETDITGEILQCVAFQDPNGSRVAATGLTFSATAASDAFIDGEVVNVYAYEWALEFEDLNDEVNFTGIDAGDFDLLSDGFYEYVGEDELRENVYAAFEEPVVLDDDVRYLFCIGYEGDIFTGHQGIEMDYQTTQDVYLQPMFPLSTGSNEWTINGYGTDIVPSIAVNMINANAVGIDEISQSIDVTPYPNPAKDFIQIPMVDVAGLTTIQIFDVAGKLVETQSFTTTTGTDLRVDVSNLEAGMYTFALRYESGNVSNFNVVIAK